MSELVDTVAWTLAMAVTVTARHGTAVPHRAAIGAIGLVVIASVSMALTGWLSGVHRGRYMIGSPEESVAVLRNVAISALFVAGTNLVFVPRLLPAAAPILAALVALVLAVGPRIAFNHAVNQAPAAEDHAEARRLLVFGAGDAGRQIIRALQRTPQHAYLPVALLDDDPGKSNRTICGVRVVGTRIDIPRVAKALRADCLLVAAPSAQPADKVAIAELAATAGIELRILPPVHELVSSSMNVTDIREVTEADLLGRPQVEIDLDAIAHYLSGRRVLVTGAGGSIGSEICRQVQRFAPAELLMLDRDESALHGVELSLGGRALLTDPNLIVADIRDRERVLELFCRRRPEVVFHAAALKHLPLLQLHPDEGVKTNIVGTKNLLDAAREIGVTHFINISTDKAADPSSVLGATKLIAECLTAEAGQQATGRYVSVRFGNVLGSRGSVLPTFRRQIDAGGPVTVTHPDVTRFFMTTEEAVRLVFQAAAIGDSGEVLILDMGEPVRIDDLARRLIARSGRRVDIQYTGLRPGEKLHEVLVGTDEDVAARQHPLVLHARVPHLTPEALRPLASVDLQPYGVIDELLRGARVLTASDAAPLA